MVEKLCESLVLHKKNTKILHIRKIRLVHRYVHFNPTSGHPNPRMAHSGCLRDPNV